MSGTFVAVVGPSGVGKDSLITYARNRLAASGRVAFVRRVVTREADCDSEDHLSVDLASFADMERAGQFALHWDAHGLRYGLPREFEADLADGKVVVANLSRRVVPAAMERYPEAVVVLVTADRHVLEQRLLARGRETPHTVARRLAQGRVDTTLPASTIRIDNSGGLDEAGEQLVRLLEDAAGLASD